MEKLHIATGHYINLYGKNGQDIYIIINEANDVDELPPPNGNGF